MLIGYARPSTRDTSPSVQMDALIAAGCGTVFVEKLVAGQRDRPELLIALEGMESGDTLVVWRLNRLARSVRQLGDTLADLRQRKLGLKILNRQLDTEGQDGALIFRAFEAVTEFEREIAIERSKAGIQVAQASGKRGGRKPAMGPAEITRAKIMLMDSNFTVEEIARQIGVQPSTLYRHIPGGRSSLHLSVVS